jgi:hypothetical protein
MTAPRLLMRSCGGLVLSKAFLRLHPLFSTFGKYMYHD